MRTDVGGRVIFVLTDAGRQAEQNQALAGGHPPRLRLEAQVVDVERVISAGAGDVQRGQITHQVTDGDAGNQQ